MKKDIVLDIRRVVIRNRVSILCASLQDKRSRGRKDMKADFLGQYLLGQYQG